MYFPTNGVDFDPVAVDSGLSGRNTQYFPGKYQSTGKVWCYQFTLLQEGDVAAGN